MQNIKNKIISVLISMIKLLPISWIRFIARSYVSFRSIYATILGKKVFGNFFLSEEDIKSNSLNCILFGIHPYTIQILYNGLKNSKENINVLLYGKIFSVYRDLVNFDMKEYNLHSNYTFNYTFNYGKQIEKDYESYLKNIDLFLLDFQMPIQFFRKQKLLYLNHRFNYEPFFNRYQLSEWTTYIDALQQDDVQIIASNNYDLNYHDYFLGGKKEILFAHPIIDYIQDTYIGDTEEFLIVPGKDKIFSQREHIMDQCIESLHQQNITQVQKITKRYYNTKYSFKEIAQYKALIVIPYTVYTGSINDFLEMEMPMFFPSVKLLAKWHYETNLLSELDCTSLSRELFGKNLFQGEFAKKLAKKLKLNEKIPNPLEDSLKSLEYRIGMSDRYTTRPVITFDSFEELGNLLQTTDMKQYSKILAEFNKRMKDESSMVRKKILEQSS